MDKNELVHFKAGWDAALKSSTVVRMAEAMSSFVNRKRPPSWIEILEMQAEFKKLTAAHRTALGEK
jgi:hypothetical protein